VDNILSPLWHSWLCRLRAAVSMAVTRFKRHLTQHHPTQPGATSPTGKSPSPRTRRDLVVPPPGDLSVRLVRTGDAQTTTSVAGSEEYEANRLYS
jgi:hypothetical protein